MMTSQRPIRTTIFFGLICGLMFILIRMFFENTFLWPFFFRVTIFACLAAYSLILASWGNKRRISVLFPLLFLFLFVFCESSNSAFLLLSLSRRGKLGVSCRVKVPVGRKISNGFL